MPILWKCQHFPQLAASAHRIRRTNVADTIFGMKVEKSKTRWTDPVKDREAKESTLEIGGDFGQFVELMKKAVKVRPPREAKPASPGPVASS